MTGHIRKRTTQKGTSWQIIIDRGVDSKGKRIRDYITVNGVKKDAQRVLNEKLNELNRGTYSVPSGVTVEKHMLDWIETYAKPNLSPSTVRGYLVNINNHTIPYIGNIPLQKLAPIHVQNMINDLQTKGLSPRTIKYAYATLRESLQYAMKMQLIQKNPADFATLPKQVKYKAKAYDEEECIKMLQAAKGTEMETPMNLALGLGLRRGELLALKWSDVDLQKGEVSISRNLIFENG
ncbi:MAG: tyrosine recombinase XerC [Eubacteriales bacterium]